MCNCSFNIEAFMGELKKNRAISPDFMRTIQRAVKRARGEKPLELVKGGLYRSPRGLRLLTRACSYYNIICVGGAGVFGSKISKVMTNEDSVVEYMEDHRYKLIGRIDHCTDLMMHMKEEFTP